MQLLNFAKDKAKPVLNYNSIFTAYNKIIKTENATNFGFMYVEANGLVGRHRAPVPQLFIVIEGDGWVQGESDEKVKVQKGEAVLWEKGESHVCGSQKGLTAIVIQSAELQI